MHITDFEAVCALMMRTKGQATTCGLLFMVVLGRLTGTVRARTPAQKELSTVRYTTSWAVQVEGGKELADQVASRCGFVNLGKVFWLLNGKCRFEVKRL